MFSKAVTWLLDGDQRETVGNHRDYFVTVLRRSWMSEWFLVEDL